MTLIIKNVSKITVKKLNGLNERKEINQSIILSAESSQTQQGYNYIYTSEHEPGLVRELVIYDVPVGLDVTKLLDAFGAWSKVISIRRKPQKKYQTIRLKVVLNDMIQCISK